MTESLKEKTARGFAWSTVSNLSQIVMNVGFGIVLARLLSPSDYGMVGLLSIFGLIASALQDSGFRVALANRKEIRHEDYNAVFWFNVAVGVGLYVLLFACAPLITAFYQQTERGSQQDLSALTALARYTFLGFVFASFGTAHCAYLFRTLQVKQKAIITVTSLSTSSLVGITMAYMGFAYWGIATQSMVFTLCNTLLFWHFSHWRPSLPVSFQPLKEMFGFSSRLLVTDIFAHINNNLLTIVLGRFYSVQDVGYFNQANKWTYMGSNTLMGVVKEVAQPVLRGVQEEQERQKRVFRKMLRLTSLLTFPALLGLALIARELVLITITDKWWESIGLMQLLCIGGAALPIQHLCLNLVVSRGRSDLVMWNTIAIGCVQVAAALLSHPYGIHTMVIVYVAVNLAWVGVWLAFVRRETGLRLREALADMMPYAICAAATMALTALLLRGIEQCWLLLVLKMVVAATLYALFMWLSGSRMFRECVEFALHRGSYANKR